MLILWVFFSCEMLQTSFNFCVSSPMIKTNSCNTNFMIQRSREHRWFPTTSFNIFHHTSTCFDFLQNLKILTVSELSSRWIDRSDVWAVSSSKSKLFIEFVQQSESSNNSIRMIWDSEEEMSRRPCWGREEIRDFLFSVLWERVLDCSWRVFLPVTSSFRRDLLFYWAIQFHNLVAKISDW